MVALAWTVFDLVIGFCANAGTPSASDIDNSVTAAFIIKPPEPHQRRQRTAGALCTFGIAVESPQAGRLYENCADRNDDGPGAGVGIVRTGSGRRKQAAARPRIRSRARLTRGA